VTFWEDKTQAQVADEVLGFCVTPNSSEDLLLGKPSLDHLGFVSDKFSIELRVPGVASQLFSLKLFPKTTEQAASCD